MDIQEFFQLCNGKWVSQRTTHYLLEQKNQSDRSDLWIDYVEAGSPKLSELCQQFSVDSTQTYGGLEVRWSEVAEPYQSRFKTQKEGSALITLTRDGRNSASGQILRQLDDSAMNGIYQFGTDEALTIVLSVDGFVTEERMWFASPNLRLRSSITRQADLVCTTSFCSEIRMSPPVDKPGAESQKAQSSTL